MIRSAVCKWLSVMASAGMLIWGGCAGPRLPEQQVRSVIAQAELAVEARDIGDIRPLIDDNYSDGRGHSKKDIENLLRGLFLTHQSIHLLIHVESLQFSSADMAEVVAVVGMADTADALPDVDLYQFDVRLIDHGDGDWKLVDVEWRRGLGKSPER